MIKSLAFEQAMKAACTARNCELRFFGFWPCFFCRSKPVGSKGMDKEMQDEFKSLQEKIIVMRSERAALKKELERLKGKRDGLIHSLDVSAQALSFIEGVASSERKAAKKRVEGLITSCLHEVFDETYSVEFEYGSKRSRTNVEVRAVHECPDGMVVRRTIDGIGGGLADMISLPLKLVVLLNDGALDRVLVVDEPGKHLSSMHVKRFAGFMSEISHRLGVQVIMSSHHASMEEFADTVNEVSLDGSSSVVERLK